MAIIRELRDELQRRPESYREIGRQIGVDHALLLRFASGAKSLSSDTAERLADYLGMRLVKKT
jgi:transcriptional regulator with XRE-family HTH domain